MGYKVAIAGTESIDPAQTCTSDGVEWQCGIRARTAVRLWLRGRALSCQVPPEADREFIVANCRLGKQDVGAWLVSNGWARAVAGGPYAAAEQRRARPGWAFSARSLPFRQFRSSEPRATAANHGGSAARSLHSAGTGGAATPPVPRQRPLDQRARLGDAVERRERAEARAALLADQHLVDHLEEGDRHARAAFRALPGVVLVALDLARDVERGVLDRFAVGAGRQRGQRVGKLASACRSTSSGAR